MQETSCCIQKQKSDLLRTGNVNVRREVVWVISVLSLYNEAMRYDAMRYLVEGCFSDSDIGVRRYVCGEGVMLST